MMINNHYPYVKKGEHRVQGEQVARLRCLRVTRKSEFVTTGGNIVPSVFPEMFPVIIPQSRITRECFLCSPKNTHTGGFFYE